MPKATHRTTDYTYDGNSNLLTLKALLTGGAFQTAQYVYGVYGVSTTVISSNDLLAEVRYPDKTSGNPSTLSSDKETFTYNALGERLTRSDRNGSVHSYSYDVLGRMTADAVTMLGGGVNGAVRRIETAYDTAGRPFRFTSYDAASAGNVVNQVQRDYNGLSQLITEYQSHSGVVNTSTTPKVQYAYSEMAGGANYSRLTSVTYPNGRVINYTYATGLDNTISRLSSLTDGAITLEGYSYLGLGTVVIRSHPQPGMDLTYLAQTGDPALPAAVDPGDPYKGLDRFGRVRDQRWRKTSDGTHTDRFTYGYDRDSNRLYRENLVDAAFSELYHANGASAGYDPLNQLSDFRYGVLSDTNSDSVPDTVTTASRTQEWAYDALGNWNSVTTDGNAQTRGHDKQNQITSIAGLTTPTYDNNGNTTTDQAGKRLKYDAWNRLVDYRDSTDTTSLVAYQYDALNRRIVEVRSITTDLYYSAVWQVLEEREGTLVRTQHVWSPVCVDALLVRDRDTNGDGILEERLYAQHGANFNVTAVISASGNVLERYVEDAYGQVTYLAPDWSVRGSSSYGWVYLHKDGRFEIISGLYHLRNREYSPAFGRWVQRDPIEYGSGDNNPYRSSLNNPINWVDPSGLLLIAAQIRSSSVNSCHG